MLSHRISMLIHLLVIFSLIVPIQNTPAQAAQPAVEPGQPQESGLFRAWVTLPNTTGRARLDKLGVRVISSRGQQALVLATADQLESLARLRFQPQDASDLGVLVQDQPGLARELQPLLERAGAAYQVMEKTRLEQKGEAVAAAADSPDALAAQLNALAPEQAAALGSLISPDSDGDGLTDTQEAWWCTDPQSTDSDGDGVKDGDEVNALMDWMGNRRDGPPASGKPFAGWPPQTDSTGYTGRHFACQDDDRDSVPDMAERWDLGLNMNRESTDLDKFDDGQELFGATNCPGGDLSCGYGDLPRSSDSGYVGANMPSWVKAPGNHPLVAAFPKPEITVIESSFHVQTLSTITTDHSIASGTEKSYSSSKTTGTSTSIANTISWQEWLEVSDSLSQRVIGLTTSRSGSITNNQNLGQKLFKYSAGSAAIVGGSVLSTASLASCPTMIANGMIAGGLFAGVASGGAFAIPGAIAGGVAGGLICGAGIVSGTLITDWGVKEFQKKDQVDTSTRSNNIKGVKDNLQNCKSNKDQLTQTSTCEKPDLTKQPLINQSPDPNSMIRMGEGNRYTFDDTGQLLANQLYEIKNVLSAPVQTHTETNGRSWGGAQTTTNTQYEEQTITNGEAFSNEESWGNATAIDSAHSADLWFSYKVRNNGTEYAQEIASLVFNIYINDDPYPVYTYFIAADLGGDGKLHNFMPGEEHIYTSRHIPLTLDQMKNIDMGGKIRIVVEDFSYGSDELFYQNAANAGIFLAIEDGVDDGDETVDHYILPTWGNETVLDVVTRYFPYLLDEEDKIKSIWTPEYRISTPAWCIEPQRYGSILWCKHALSSDDWWNIYMNNMGDGSVGMQDTPAIPGASALFRFNKDSDLDGYSDRSEVQMETDPMDALSFPHPELLAGILRIQSNNYVTATLSLLNTGMYDAYGVEAIMVAPDDSTTVVNNTVGGSGRVKAQKQVIVGSLIQAAEYTSATWTGTAQPASGGYYTGSADRTYSFTVSCSNPGGCEVGKTDTWTLQWSDGQGANGGLNFGAGYASPILLDVGPLGVRLSMLSGKVFNGNTFTVDALTPRDTFQYVINRTPYSAPLVIVSYNDPQGNHRFIIPPAAMDLSKPTTNLAGFAGQMLKDASVDIVTKNEFNLGVNSIDLLVNNPTTATLENSHLFLEFINITGTVVSEVPYTATIQSGPNVLSLDWSTDNFTPAFKANEDYIVMAFWTDYQGNILDTAGRPLSSFQQDPSPASAMAATDETWDFGAARQGTLLQRQFTLGSVGYQSLLTYLGEAQGISVEGPASAPIAPADIAVYTVTVNTENLPVGAFKTQIPIRTSDPQTPSRTITIQGTVEAFTPDNTQVATLRPLDWNVTITGTHSQGEWITLTHTLGPDAQTLHPVKVYSQDYATLLGVAKYGNTDCTESVCNPWEGETLLHDDFDTLVPGRWSFLHGDWGVSGGYLTGSNGPAGVDAWAYAGNESWKNYSLKTRINIAQQDVMVVFRSTGEHRTNEYQQWINKAGSWRPNMFSLLRCSNGGCPTIFPYTSPTAISDYVDVQIDAFEDHLQLYLNGTKRIDFHDPTGLAAGKVGFGVIMGTLGRFDYIDVKKLESYIAEQLNMFPYNGIRLRLPESFTSGSTYAIQYGQRYTFTGAGATVQSIRIPRQIYASSSLDALVNNTGVSSGLLNLSLDIGNNGSVDWSSSANTSFPATFAITNVVNALNAYMVSQSSVPWGANVDVPFKVQVDRQADVMLTNLALTLQLNQPSQLAHIALSSDRPLDSVAAITGTHNLGEWVNFTHTLGPDAQTLHPVKVYSLDYGTLWGVGKYATEFGNPGTASSDMFGNGQDGSLTIAANTTNNPIDSACSGSEGSTTLSATNIGFSAGQRILIHQSQGTNAGIWMVNKILGYSAGAITLEKPLNTTYRTGAQVIVLKQYSDVTINTGVTWSAKAWNGTTGGILAFLANGTITINGTISAMGAGYRGGGSNTVPAYQDCRSSSYAAWSGEGTSGQSQQNITGNSNGNGGGPGNHSTAPCNVSVGGGGGGNGTSGETGGGQGGQGGSVQGAADLSLMVYGGGGGGGQSINSDPRVSGVNGGGIIFITGSRIVVNNSASVNANGLSLAGTNTGASGGGGGGGSILLKAKNVGINSGLITASGGVHGAATGGYGMYSAAGGQGRIRIEYCDSISGFSNPVASEQKLTCYITEQVEITPYTQSRLNLPESISNGRTYAFQYGRRYTFTGAGATVQSIRIPRQIYASSSLDALVNNTGVSSGLLNLSLDIGNNGSVDWNSSANTSFPATFAITNVVNALNAYMVSQSSVPWGGNVDVPFKVQVDRQADVMLTNLALNAVGVKTRYLRLPARSYSSLGIDFAFDQPGGGSTPLAFTVDVGADGSVDASYSAAALALPGKVTLSQASLTAAINAYLSGRSGEVDVPLRITPSPALQTSIAGYTFQNSLQPDLSLSAGDISFSAAAPKETDTLTVTALVHNTGGLESAGATAAFFATLPDWGDWYIGSALVGSVPPGGSLPVSIPWNTLGFSGDIPLRMVIDPAQRRQESSRDNNQAVKPITILTRADLSLPSLELSDPDPVAGQPVTLTLHISNTGQTAAPAGAYQVFDGLPEAGGALIGQASQAVPAQGTGTLSFTWLPAYPGAYRLYALADAAAAVSEALKNNNTLVKEVYVGLAGPVVMDSGTLTETAYSAAAGYGFVDLGQPDEIGACGLSTAETYRKDLDGKLLYRFDHLQPHHAYHLDLTLYNCAGEPQRLENVYVDGSLVAGPEDLGDGEEHNLSLRLDPALYADHAISVTIEAPGVNGAVVSGVSLHDIDYRYADAGGAGEGTYTAGRGFGWLDGTASAAWGTLPYQSVRIDLSDYELRYRFDDLKSERNYNLRLTFWQGSGTGSSTFKVQVNGADIGSLVTLATSERQDVSIPIPPVYYQGTGNYIVVGILRQNVKGPFVNEIALEEETVASRPRCEAKATPYFVDVYGGLVFDDRSGRPGQVVQAISPRGDTVGCFIVDQIGQYGFMRIYGEDTTATPNIPGMRDGELVTFAVNGLPARSDPAFYWNNDPSAYQVDLLAFTSPPFQSIHLKPGWNLVSFNVEPFWPLVHYALDSGRGRYDRVLSDELVYNPALGDSANSLTELHSGKAYYLRVTGSTDIDLLVKGMPQAADTPLPLNLGWNYIGFYPTTSGPIASVLQSIDGQYQKVLSLDKAYYPSLPQYSTLKELKAGEGYLLYASGSTNLIYPANPGQSQPSIQPNSTSCAAVAPTPNFTLFYGQVQIEGLPAPAGTRVEFLTPRNELAGCAVLQETGLLAMTHVYGVYGEGGPGFRPDEPVTVRVNGRQVDLTTPPTWQNDWDIHPLELNALPIQYFLPFLSK